MASTENGAAADLSNDLMAPTPLPSSTNGTTPPPLSPTVSGVTDKKDGEVDKLCDSSKKPVEKKLPKDSSEDELVQLKASTENGAAADLSTDLMARTALPSSTNGTISPPLSPPVSGVTDKKYGEVDKLSDSSKKPVEKKLPKDSSEDELVQLMERIDPSGFLTVLCSVSTVVVALRFWYLSEFWSTSLSLCMLLFFWTIAVSDSPKTVVLGFSHILLLSCAAVHFVGPLNGMMVMFIGTLYAAGLLGYTFLGYCQRLGIGKSAHALVTAKANGRKHDEVGASLLCFVISVWSLACFARIAWLVLAPDTSHRTFFEAFDYVVEVWPEICCSVGMWIMYITQLDLGGSVLSMDTLAWAVPSFLFSGLLIAVALFLAISDAVAIFFLWIGAMPVMGFFGYVLALRASCKTIISSCHPSTKWEQRSDKVYFTFELADAKDVILKLKPDGHFNFSAKGLDEIQYELHLHLFGAIDVEESKVAIAPGTRCYLIKKAESNWWPRLFKKEGKPPVFLKVDLDKWRNEDDEDTGSDDFVDMIFVKLDNGGDDDG